MRCTACRKLSDVPYLGDQGATRRVRARKRLRRRVLNNQKQLVIPSRTRGISVNVSIIPAALRDSIRAKVFAFAPCAATSATRGERVGAILLWTAVCGSNDRIATRVWIAENLRQLIADNCDRLALVVGIASDACCGTDRIWPNWTNWPVVGRHDRGAPPTTRCWGGHKIDRPQSCGLRRANKQSREHGRKKVPANRFHLQIASI